MPARLAIVVPTYQRVDLLTECLASLNAQTFRDFHVIVVDDASPENVASAVERVCPGAEVVRRAANGGFARAANDGIRRADSPLIMLLNDDMTLAPDCLELLVGGMDSSGAAMACPLVLFRDQRDTIYSAGDRITRGGRPESIGFRQKRNGFEFDRHPFAVSAGAALYTRKLFDRVGLFDESFIAYFEDVDLSMRARAAGFEAVCVPEAVAHHVGSASQTGSTLWRTRQCYRNHALLVMKNLGWREIAVRSPWILAERCHQAGRVISAYRSERGLTRACLAYLSAATETVRAISPALRGRRTATLAR